MYMNSLQMIDSILLHHAYLVMEDPISLLRRARKKQQKARRSR